MRSASRFALVVALLLSGGATGCLLDENLIKQPELSVVPGMPPGWGGTSDVPGIGTTVTDRHEGTQAAYLSNSFQQGFRNFVLVQQLRADEYRGKRLRLSAWVRPRNLNSVTNAGIWMRVDGPGNTLAFDNMAGRAITGYGDWRQISVVLDVGPTAIGIAFGALFQAANTMLIDDMKLEVVGDEVKSTSTVTTPIASGRDSATTVAAYAQSGFFPVNLNFEGLPPIGATTSAWLQTNAATLTTTDPTASLNDLEPLREMVGSAHVVGLGEGTHGTREFFLLKHRILRFLVERMGFTTFAIEATSPEADDINRYVMTGEGDPERLLSQLYFWTWRTQEVLDQIRWMRQWNITAPANQRVQFRGFDMQYPSGSIDSVIAFVHRTAPSRDATVLANYLCIDPYRNTGRLPGRALSQYALSRVEDKDACRESIAAVYDIVRGQSTAAVGYAGALHHARLVQQFEAYAGAINSALSNRARDDAMAENIAWLREQGGPDARIVVWAHNLHVMRRTDAMGAFLNTRFGSDYRPLGFAFGTGRFNAVRQTGSALGNVESHNTTYMPPQSIESAFMLTERPLMLLDMRKLNVSNADAAPLRGPISMRNMGCCYDPEIESAYFSSHLFPTNYDLMVFVRTGTATTLLPFIN